MRAVRLQSPGRVKCVDVVRPQAAEGGVVLEVSAAGLCHTDLHLADSIPGSLPYAMPFTLGHEIAGRVVETGAGVNPALIGDHFVVYAPWGCATCARCDLGVRQYCDRAPSGIAGLGLGADGGMAEYVAVAAHRLVAAPDLDPREAATLTDAALTSYHAIAQCRHLLQPGSRTLVVGVGGLGHLALQVLRATTATHITAIDTRSRARDLALLSGAHEVCADVAGSDAGSPGHPGFDVVLDFVGSDVTIASAVTVLRSGGHLAIVGSGRGRLVVTKPRVLPPGTCVSLPYWGSAPELEELVRLATAGLVRPVVESFTLDELSVGFAALRAGEVLGRAVMVP